MKSIPKGAIKFLRIFCPDHLLEEVEGDLIQQFDRDEKRYGWRKARRRLVWNTIRFFRPGIILRNKFSIELNQLYMIQNYFKIAYRQLMKSKAFSLINVLGLSVGITAFLLIIQYVTFEMSYDQFHVNHEAIYRVGLRRYQNGELQEATVRTFPGIRSLLKDNFPEVKHFTGFFKIPANTGFLFRYNGKVYNEPGGILNPDSAFFKVFPSLLVKGDAATVLKEKQNLVISESVAHKIFGEANPIGQTIERIDDYDEGSDFVITGVLKDIPDNSHVHAAFIQNMDGSWRTPEYWKGGLMFTYITLSAESNPDKITDRINALLRKVERENPVVKGTNVFLQPITDIHLTSHFKDELDTNGSKTLVYGLALIGLVIMVMAWINYVNLETARFISRAKSIGLRRIIGSKKSDLVLQFLIEYFCLAVAAMLVAILLFFSIVPHFTTFTGVQTTIQWTQSNVWIMIGLFVLGSIIVGSYPAFFLLKINPLATLKGHTGAPNRGRLTRRSLVIIQFTASLVLIAFVMVINKQLDYMHNTNKKIDLEHVIALRNPTAYADQDTESKHNEYKTFENKLLQSAAVKMVASSSAIPGAEIGFSYINLIKRHRSDPYDPTIYKTLFVDNNFIATYGLKLLAGKNFTTPETGGQWIQPWEDKNWTTIILNESAIHQLGFQSPEEAVDQVVDFRPFDDFLSYRIIGVVEDYHHEAIKKAVYPTIFAPNYSAFQQVYYSIRLNAGSNPRDALNYIEKSWKEIFPTKPFEYFFIDDYYDQQFKAELSFANTFTLFAGIAIFIASLGVVGMSLFEANARLKEISIRKVLGASIVNLIVLLAQQYFVLVVVAGCIGFPMLYYLAIEWLNNYPIHIDVSWMVFLVPLLIVALLVVVTSCIQTIKAALTNPVDYLKNE